MAAYNPDVQRLFIGEALNAREMGAMPLADGKVFKKGLFVRSGSPKEASPEGLRLMKEYNIKTVIDLRSPIELNKFGNPFAEDPDINFMNIPLFRGDPDALDKDDTMVFLRTHQLGDFYVIVLQTLQHEIANVLKVLTDNEDGVCLFHCAHGKDRTGIIAALLYLLAGASREDIILNYKVSYDYAADFLDPLIAKREDILKHTLRSDAVNMEIMLNWLDSEYDGDVISYLLSAGLSMADINKLRKKIICDP